MLRKVFENALRDTRRDIFLRKKKNSNNTWCCYPIFDQCFDKFSEKSKNREKQ
jgi:Mg2+ and Co2+ transporter CorA